MYYLCFILLYLFRSASDALFLLPWYSDYLLPLYHNHCIYYFKFPKPFPLEKPEIRLCGGAGKWTDWR